MSDRTGRSRAALVAAAAALAVVWWWAAPASAAAAGRVPAAVLAAGPGWAAAPAPPSTAPGPSATPAPSVSPPVAGGAGTTDRAGAGTTAAPARCQAVPPVAVQFVGTVTTVAASAVRLRVDRSQIGPRLEGSEVEVTFVRDARFFRPGRAYLVVAALDPESGSYVSKVRTPRGTDPRCVALDPITTTLADGTAIDTGVFSGLKGTQGKVLRAVLLPLGAAVGLLAALVAVKWLAIWMFRGLRRLTRRPVRT